MEFFLRANLPHCGAGSVGFKVVQPLEYILPKVKVLVAQSCPTLSDPMGCSLPSSSVHEIFQARVLEWVASPGDLPDPGIEPGSPALQADSLPTEPLGKKVNDLINLIPQNSIFNFPGNLLLS